MTSVDPDNPYQPTVLDLFEPPAYEPPVEPEWATFIPSRGHYPNSTITSNGAWKVHSSKGAARGSMTHMKGQPRILFHLEEIGGVKKWVQVERHDG